MLLSSLVGADVTAPPGSGSIDIAGLTADSRQVRPGYLFVAIAGAKADGARLRRRCRRRGRGGGAGGRGDEVASCGGSCSARTASRGYALALAARFWGAQPATASRSPAPTARPRSPTSAARSSSARPSLRQHGHARLVSPAAPDQPARLTTPDAGDVAAAAGRPRGRAASPTWRSRPRRTASTSAGWTACALTAAGFLNLDPGPPRLSRHDGGLPRRQAAPVRELLPPRGRTAVLNADSDAYAGRSPPPRRAAGRLVFSVGAMGEGLTLDGSRAKALGGQRLRIGTAGRNFDVRLPLAGAFQAVQRPGRRRPLHRRRRGDRGGAGGAASTSRARRAGCSASARRAGRRGLRRLRPHARTA